MRNRTLKIFESVLDDLESNKESAVERVRQIDNGYKRLYLHDYEFEEECFNEKCDCLVCLNLDVTDYSDDEIVKKVEDVREKFELIVERRFENHSYIFTGAKRDDLNKRGIDLLNRAEMGVASNIGTRMIRGNYSIVFAVGLKVELNEIYRFIDLLANIYGLMRSSRDNVNNGSLPTGYVDVLKLRSADVKYTHQYTPLDINFTTVDADRIACCLYDCKYYGTSFLLYEKFKEILVEIFEKRHPGLKTYSMIDSINKWIKTYDKSKRSSKYKRAHI